MQITTLQTIANLVHYSRSTVSRVLNDQWNEHGISEATAELVIAKAKELNYIKNEGASSLRAKKTFTIGVIVRDITNPFYTQLVKFVENALYTKGYTVIICNTGYDLEKENGHINVLLRRRVDGIILSPNQKSIDNISLIKDRNVPLAFFDCKIDEIEADYILVDNEAGTSEAVNHLISKGHKKIAYIGGDPFESNNRLRYEGYKKSLSKAALPIREHYVKHSNYTFKHGYEASKELIRLNDAPTAFFAANNRIVLGAYKGIIDCGLHIPEDVSIIGFDDFETAIMLPIRLTVVCQPIEEIALCTVDLLLSRINNTNTQSFVTKILKTELILRQSIKGLA
ncbi:MAG: LacI family DNA-binding transcriptional regulator [Candidatus Marinimicrobia bacterium]|nr:LacI family DNA-binding transcriptional regulator [Candidatus Neomarinimicrobiota bacterium]